MTPTVAGDGRASLLPMRGFGGHFNAETLSSGHGAGTASISGIYKSCSERTATARPGVQTRVASLCNKSAFAEMVVAAVTSNRQSRAKLC